MNITEFVQKFKQSGKYPLCPRVVCSDGFSISVQCNSGSYCHPREDRAPNYDCMELGFPSELDPVTDSIISPWAETPDTAETVFGFVPVEAIDRLLNAHGGIKWIMYRDSLVAIEFASLVTEEQGVH